MRMLEKKEILERLRRVQLLILDEDGVLTDGSINIGPDGKEVFKKFDVKDGHALKHQVHDFDVRTAIITGRTSSIVDNHACELDIDHLYQGQKNKRMAFQALLDLYALTPANVTYMGDDRPDVPLLEQVGFAAVPHDAHVTAKAVAHWISSRNGGCGAVRELIDLMIESRRGS